MLEYDILLQGQELSMYISKLDVRVVDGNDGDTLWSSELSSAELDGVRQKRRVTAPYARKDAIMFGLGEYHKGTFSTV